MSISNVARSPLVLCIAVSDSMASVQDRRPRALEAAYAAALLYVDMFPIARSSRDTIYSWCNKFKLPD